ncbi:MAG: hypothetical protein COA60_006790 [Robiginitomaculum sp.]|nr:hypothetical protein [Robiginitomaculum sp.]
MINIWLLSSAILAFAVCLLHLFAGGKIAARPLLADEEFNHIAKYTLWYAWHIVTLALLGFGVMLLIAAFTPQLIALAMAAILLVASVFLLSLAMIIKFRLKPLHFPQWLLFLPILGLGIIGLL